MSRPLRRTLAALGLLLAGACLLELGFRLLAGPLGVDRERLARFRELVASQGQVALYEPRPHVLYARPRGAPGINSLGFGDAEVPRERRAGVPRVACLGGSTTEGGNAQGPDGSYPYFLRRTLESRRGGPVELMNLGMSGWTSAEILVHYVLAVQDYAPDVVVFHEAVNDVEPRMWPGFRPDYSHYRRPWQAPRYGPVYRLLVGSSDLVAAAALRDPGAGGLLEAVVRPRPGPPELPDGRLPPGTAEPFRRNVRTLVQLARVRGARPVLVTLPYATAAAAAHPAYRQGIDEHNQVLRELARQEQAGLVDLALRAGDAGVALPFLDLVHVAPEGNRWKAEAIADFLIEERLWPQ